MHGPHSTEERSEDQLIAAFASARQAPEGCPFDACHQFWLRGACDFPVCKFKHVQGPARTADNVQGPVRPADTAAAVGKLPDAGVCVPFWTTGACKNTACTLQHTHNRLREPPKAELRVTRASLANSPPDRSWCGTFWRTGSCTYADKCRFIHTPNTAKLSDMPALGVGKGGGKGGGKGASRQVHAVAAAVPPKSGAQVVDAARAHWGPRNMREREQGVHATVAFTVVATQDMTLIAPRALFPYGWDFHYSGDADGSTWEVPGVRTYRLQQSPGVAHVYLVVVKIPPGEDHPGGVTIFDPTAAHHKGLRQYKLMVDSGAESSLISHADRDLLVRTGEFQGMQVRGIGGAVPPLGGGFIDFVFPGFRVKPMNAQLALQWHVTLPRTGGTSSAMANMSRRPSIGPTLDPQLMADRFNIFGHEQLQQMADIAEGVKPKCKVIATRDYSGGLQQRTLGRKAPARKRLNIASWAIRERLLPGEQWWADLSRMHAPDYAGNMYTRLFAEERSGYAVPMFCTSKTTADLLIHLEEMVRWVPEHVPGARLRVLRSDFGSEYAVQGRGENYIVAALRSFLADHPEVSYVPCPPHSHAFCKVEGIVQSTTGHSFTNSCRAQLGEMAWSIVEEGSCYQHNCRPVWRKDGAQGPSMTRCEALTGRRPDLSAMLGYVGQHGWTHRHDGKASAQRDNAVPMLYMYPDPRGAGQSSSTWPRARARSWLTWPSHRIRLWCRYCWRSPI